MKVKNKCGFPLFVHIGNQDGGRWVGAGQESWGTNSQPNRIWAVQPGIYGADTLAEISDVNGYIWYDIPLVDGFTYPMSLVPVGGSGGNRRNLSCIDWNILYECPDNLQLMVNGNLRACKNNSENPRYFKARCPDAYSWSGDDRSSMADTNNPDYMEVTFCP
jgi:hypothetical protein